MADEYWCGACGMEMGVDKKQNCMGCGDWLAGGPAKVPPDAQRDEIMFEEPGRLEVWWSKGDKRWIETYRLIDVEEIPGEGFQ